MQWVLSVHSARKRQTQHLSRLFRVPSDSFPYPVNHSLKSVLFSFFCVCVTRTTFACSVSVNVDVHLMRRSVRFLFSSGLETYCADAKNFGRGTAPSLCQRFFSLNTGRRRKQRPATQINGTRKAGDMRWNLPAWLHGWQCRRARAKWLDRHVLPHAKHAASPSR